MFQICYHLKIRIIKPNQTGLILVKSLITVLLMTSGKAIPKCHFSVNFEISGVCLNLREKKPKNEVLAFLKEHKCWTYLGKCWCNCAQQPRGSLEVNNCLSSYMWYKLGLMWYKFGHEVYRVCRAGHPEAFQAALISSGITVIFFLQNKRVYTYTFSLLGQLCQRG